MNVDKTKTPSTHLRLLSTRIRWELFDNDDVTLSVSSKMTHTHASLWCLSWAYFKPCCVLATKFISSNYPCWLYEKARRHYQTACTTSFKIEAVKISSSTAQTGFLAFSKRYRVFVSTSRNDSKALHVDAIFLKTKKKLRLRVDVNENFSRRILLYSTQICCTYKISTFEHLFNCL